MPQIFSWENTLQNPKGNVGKISFLFSIPVEINDCFLKLLNRFVDDARGNCHNFWIGFESVWISFSQSVA